MRAYDPATDEAWAVGLLDQTLGGRLQARRGVLVDALGPTGLVACDNDAQPIGLLSYARSGRECEVVALAAGRRYRGVGTALLEALKLTVSDCRRIWLVTTNDNVDALRFYQRRGFRLCGLRPGAVDQSRQTIKPSIPREGAHGIALRDELELELLR